MPRSLRGGRPSPARRCSATSRAALTLSADRTLDLAGLLEIRSGGSLTVGGGAQEIATLNNQGTVNHAAGTLTVANTMSNYGTMNVTAPTFAAGRLTKRAAAAASRGVIGRICLVFSARRRHTRPHE